jgi:trigger factor
VVALKKEIVEVSSCKRNLVVEVPEDQLEHEIDRLARDYAQKAVVPGFRPGKVPVSVVRQRYQSELRSNATHEIVEQSWQGAIAEHDLHPIGEPDLRDLSNEPGNPLKFTLAFEILPTIEVKDYRGIAVSLPRVDIGDKDVEDGLEAARERSAQFIPVEEGEIRDGHLVTLDVQGVFADGGKPVEEENVSIIIGAAETSAAFTENLRGARSGETRSFDVSYPPDHHRKRYAGKQVRYSAKIKEIKEKQLPEPEELAKELGLAGVEELKSKIRDELVTKAAQAAEKKARDAVLDEVLKRNPLEVPEGMVSSEMQDYAQRIAGSLVRQGIDPNKASVDWRKIIEGERPNAENAVRRTLVLDAIARQEALDVTEEELDAAFERIAEIERRPPAVIRAQAEKDHKIQSFRDHLRRNKALDFIYRNANITQG